ncbi:Uncharacterised protein [Bordetella ansorpii]|uniref:Uncharacterized protein n=1 Tax=Bordetella ansorpii TaxID=288768 RepID=A0A157PIY0_9BORD|nr:hypothetical protein [Bordetella ansorpii]SAI33473.1 Uncharacterised protein [Bordetella ansorpii]
MKKILSALMGALDTNAGDAASPPKPPQSVPAGAMLYSMPTIAMDDIEFEKPAGERVEGAPQFHEDEWAQLEFFPKHRLPEVQRLLGELKAFDAEHRVEHGWRQIHQRDLAREPLDVSLADIEGGLGGQGRPAPILTTASRPLGQVKDGFSVELGTNAYLYGLRQEGRITVLAASLQGADDMLLTRAFTALSRQSGLVLVDWRQQFLLVGVDGEGLIEVWRP